MSVLYVANCSKQNHIFAYMIKDNPRPFQRPIAAGSQIAIEFDNPEIAKQIIDQHTRYGLVQVQSIKKGFSGLCYSFDTPIKLEKILEGMDHVEQVQIDRAHDAQVKTAAASDVLISEKSQEMGIKSRAGLEIEFAEEKVNAGDQAPKFKKGIKVAHEGEATPGIRRRDQPSIQ